MARSSTARPPMSIFRRPRSIPGIPRGGCAQVRPSPIGEARPRPRRACRGSLGSRPRSSSPASSAMATKGSQPFSPAWFSPPNLGFPFFPGGFRGAPFCRRGGRSSWGRLSPACFRLTRAPSSLSSPPPRAQRPTSRAFRARASSAAGLPAWTPAWSVPSLRPWPPPSSMPCTRFPSR